jgi:hypothetical protein
MDITNRYQSILSDDIHVEIIATSGEYLQLIANHNDEINIIWDKAQNDRGDHKLFNGSILNVINCNDTSPVAIQCHVIEYKHYLAQRHGMDLGITPLAVTAVTHYHKGDDHFILMAKRSEHVTQYPNHLEFCPSGSVEDSDFKRQILAELSEELGLSKNDAQTCKPFCVINDSIGNIINISVDITLNNDVIIAHQNDEYSHIDHVPFNAIDDFLDTEQVVTMSQFLLNQWRSHRDAT